MIRELTGVAFFIFSYIFLLELGAAWFWERDFNFQIAIMAASFFVLGWAANKSKPF